MVFKNGSRLPNLHYSHHNILAIQQLTDVQRSDLLEKARENQWTAARLKKERDLLLGRPEKVATLEFDAQVDSLLKELPPSVSKKAKNEVVKVYNNMKREFVATVEKEVNKRVQSERDRLLEIEKQAQADREKAGKMLAGITPIMTQDEFKTIRSLLHPDRHPEDSEKYNQAFTVFNRLLETINPNIPIAVKRKRGWAD